MRARKADGYQLRTRYHAMLAAPHSYFTPQCCQQSMGAIQGALNYKHKERLVRPIQVDSQEPKKVTD